jgi:DNA-directed RNA polymerase subunit RPC12/RpoP
MRAYCFQCDKPFWNRKEKREHEKRVHTVEKVRRLYICETCGKDFKDNYYLEAHILSHKAKPHLKCTYPGCEASFYIQSVLK